jgi:hypothetical protein
MDFGKLGEKPLQDIYPAAKYDENLCFIPPQVSIKES